MIKHDITYGAGIGVAQLKTQYTLPLPEEPVSIHTVSGTVTERGEPLSVNLAVDGVGTITSSRGTGRYEFSVTEGYSGVVIPLFRNGSFAPLSREYTNVVSDYTDQNYELWRFTFILDGNTYQQDDNGVHLLPAVPISFTNGVTTVITDGSAHYNAPVPHGYSGVATPQRAGGVFSPTERLYTNITAPVSQQDYVFTPAHYIISGAVTENGSPVWVNLSVDGMGIITNDRTTGLYSFVVASGYSGSVVPLFSNGSFTPLHRAYSNVVADQLNQDYALWRYTFILDGNTYLQDGITPFPGILISFTNGVTTVITDGSAHYNATVPHGYNGVATPYRAGGVFSPVTRTYANVVASAGVQDYAYTPTATPTYLISGTITSNGVGYYPAWVAFGGDRPSVGIGGRYQYAVLAGYSGAAVPGAQDIGVFTPDHIDYSSVAADMPDQNYDFVPIVSLGGTVWDELSYSPIAGVPVVANGVTLTSATNGSYGFDLLQNELYLITPTRGGGAFDPLNYAGTATVDDTGLNFTFYYSGSLPPVTVQTISGTVTNSTTHAVVVGATVTVGSVVATTNGSGYYQVAIKPGFWTIVGEKTGYYSYQSSPLSVAPSEAKIWNIAITPLPTPPVVPSSISGVVTNSSTHAVIPGATITVGTTVTTTDSFGHYYVTVSSSGTNVVLGAAVGYHAYQSANFSVLPSEAKIWNFSMTPLVTPPPAPATISGVVTDSSSHAVLPGVAVTVARTTVVTDSFGYYLISVSPSTWTIAGVKSGYFGYQSSPFTVDPGEDMTWNIALTPVAIPPVPSTISGVVTDSTTHAVLPGVTITVGALATTTDSSGHYLVTVSSSGTNVVTGAKSNYSAYQSANFSVAPAEAKIWNFSMIPTVTPPIPATISGVVTNSSTHAVIPGATVTVGSQVTTTDSSGHYQMVVAAGFWTIAGAKTGYFSYQSSPLSIAAADSVTWNIALTPNTVQTISGVVRDSATQAFIVGAVVTVGAQAATTNSSGYYQIAIAAGTWTIASAKTGYFSYQSSPFSVAPSTAMIWNISMTLQPTPPPVPATISGVVTDSATNAVLAGVGITVGALTTTTDASGYYTITVVAAGFWTIAGAKTGYYSYQSSPFSIAAAEAKIWNIALTPTVIPSVSATISGVVTDSNTNAVLPGVTVRVGTQLATTDESGYYRITIAAGTWYVLGDKADYLSYQSANFSVASTEAKVWNFSMVLRQLTVRTTLSGIVTDARTGAPLTGVTVTVGVQTATTDATGVYTLNLSSAGNLTLTGALSSYVTYACLVSVVAATDNVWSFSLSPVGVGVRMVVNWKSTPQDLDLYLKTPVIGGRMYHVFYPQAYRYPDTANPPYATIDFDVRYGIGPETITIKTPQPGTYYFYVNNYKDEAGNTGELANCGAVAQLYDNNNLVETFYIPATPTGPASSGGVWDYWNICLFDGDTHIVSRINQIISTQPGPMIL